MGSKEKKAALILGIVVLTIVLILLALMNISVFFIAVVILILLLCLIRMKKPEWFAGASETGDGEEEGSAEENESNAFRPSIVLLYYGGITTQQITVDRQDFSIGRAKSCNLVLDDDTTIGRQHAIIHYDADTKQSILRDNHSRNGTKVNGNPMREGGEHILRDGDMIQIGDRILTVQKRNY